MSVVCGSCAGSTSSCLPRHTALHCVCVQSCGELTPTASHCTVLCIESCGELTPTVSHCTVLCIESCGKLTPTVSHCTVPCVQSCGSAQCSIILRLHQVLASCCFFFFFLLPFASFEVQSFVKRDRRVMVCLLWGGKHGWAQTGEPWHLAAEVLGGELYGFQQGAECGLSSVCTSNSLASCVFFSVSLISVVPACYNLSPWRW